MNTEPLSPSAAQRSGKPGQPNEFTAVSPEVSGKVTNRPTPTGAELETFNRAAEQERQEDA